MRDDDDTVRALWGYPSRPRRMPTRMVDALGTLVAALLAALFSFAWWFGTNYPLP